MGWLRKRAVPGSVVVILVFVLLLPHILSVYHLETGARLLKKTLDSPAADRQEAAIRHLQCAIKWDKRNGQAYRSLGNALVLQGHVAEATQAFLAFTVLHPEHRLGHLELAEAHQAVQDALLTMTYADLILQLEQAIVSEPSFSTPCPFQPSDYIRIAYPDLFSDHQPVPALLLHPVSAVTYTISLTQPATLRFGMGNILHAPGSGSDGVTFEIYLNNQRLFAEHLTPDMARSEWQEREVDLSEFSGQTIALRLSTTPGPAGDVTADWAVWGWPRVEAPEAKAYRDVSKQVLSQK